MNRTHSSHSATHSSDYTSAQPPTEPTLATVMTPSPVVIDMRASLEQARNLMLRCDIHHLVVVDDGNPESIISRADLQKVLLAGGRDLTNTELCVGDLCHSRAYLADLNDPLSVSLRAMAEAHGATVIVLDQGELAGIFTPSDACRLLADWLSDSDTLAHKSTQPH